MIVSSSRRPAPQVQSLLYGFTEGPPAGSAFARAEFSFGNIRIPTVVASMPIFNLWIPEKERYSISRRLKAHRVEKLRLRDLRRFIGSEVAPGCISRGIMNRRLGETVSSEGETATWVRPGKTSATKPVQAIVQAGQVQSFRIGISANQPHGMADCSLASALK
jgi:hypothetical protein